MNKNRVLYILLAVLIIMNGFFLFNYLGRPDHKGPKENNDFLIKELKLNDAQLKQFEIVEEMHHRNMRVIGDGIKEYKDALFKKITTPQVNQETIDSLITLISEKEVLKEKELFNRLRGIYDLCNEEQKEHFSNIIKRARRPKGQGKGPSPKPMKRE